MCIIKVIVSIKTNKQKAIAQILQKMRACVREAQPLRQVLENVKTRVSKSFTELKIGKL